MVAGAAASGQPACHPAIDRTYRELKRLITRECAYCDVGVIELNPQSAKRQAELQEYLERCNLQFDPALLATARQLLSLVKAYYPQLLTELGVKTQDIDSGKIHASFDEA